MSSVPRRRRLGETTLAVQAPAFPERALLKARDFKIKKFQIKQAQQLQKQSCKTARSRALQLLALQPELGDGDLDADGPAAHFELPHHSHSILELQGNSQTIFCKRCSWWSSRIRLRGLAHPCLGLKQGNKSQLRILLAGLRPGPGVRLPPRFLKNAHHKGSLR